MRFFKNQRGVALIAAIFIIVVLAFMGVMFLSMINTNSFTAANDVQSAQALYVAQGGLQTAKYQLANGSTCDVLTHTTPSTLGQGAFTIAGTLYTVASTLSASILAADTIISVASNTGSYAPQGRVTIDNESIWYGGISGNSFINVRRGVVGAAANHAANAQVKQDQCRITSIGIVGNARRVVIADVSGVSNSPSRNTASYDGLTSTNISSAAVTTIGSMSTSLAAGDNLIIVMVMLQNTSGTVANINAGNLQLRYGPTVLASNQSLIRVVGTAAAPNTLNNTANNFPQKTHFFLYKHTGAPDSPAYNVVAQATVNNVISGRVKMTAFNSSNMINVYSYFSSDGTVTLTTAAGGAVLATHAAAGLPAGDNAVLAAVELDNYVATGQTISVNNLILRKGNGTGTMLNWNNFPINFEGSGNAKRGNGYLLVGRDTTGGAGQTYTVTGQATANNSITGAVRMMVMQGIPLASMSTGTVDLTTAITTLGTLTTPFSAGDTIVITATQSMDYDTHNRHIFADKLIYSGGTVSTSNVVPIYLLGAPAVHDYDTGLILYHPGAPANSAYNWQSQSDSTVGLQPIRAKTDIMALHFNRTVVIQNFGWQ